MDQTEQKIKIEGEILSLKREHKYALENLNRIKTDTAEIIATKERVTRDINERNEDLSKVLNEISEQKLTWALERQAQMDEISNKKSEADNVIKRKGELNEQEEKIRKIEANDIEVRNEIRRLELKVQGDKEAVEAEKRQLKNDIGKFESEKDKFSKDKEAFKQKVLSALKEVENLC